MKKIDYIEILRETDYDFTKFKYININKKSLLICKNHGEFLISLRSIIRGSGCKECSENIKTTNSFIEKSKKIFNNKYDYSVTNYQNSRTKLRINCSDHGYFDLLPIQHLRGQGCHFCKKDNMKLEFIEKSKKIHNNLLYEKVIYKNNKTNVILTCKKHGDFKVRPDNHLINMNGCPKCSLSKGEKIIANYLDILNIDYEIQKKFNNCKLKDNLRFDFYIKNLNICIEYNGIQHYESFDFFGGDKTLDYNKIRDKVKYDYCLNNDIKLIIIKYDENIEEKLNFLK
jgi:hypothetical protein